MSCISLDVSGSSTQTTTGDKTRGERVVVSLKEALILTSRQNKKGGRTPEQIERRRAYDKEYYRINRDRILARQRVYDATHLEAKKQRMRGHHCRMKTARAEEASA